MSTFTPTAQNGAVTTEESTANPTEAFVESVTDALAESGADQDTIELVETHGSRMVEHVGHLESENEQLSERVEHLESELESVRDRAGRDRAELSSRVTELEESHDDTETDDLEPDSPDSKGGGQTAKTTLPDAETALEDTLRLPDGVAEDSLSANQARARSVARDIGDYAEYNHQYGNYSLTAKRLRIVLKAQYDGETAAHHETVNRVRDFLNRLGESEVTVTTDRGGTKRLVFAESLVDRIEAYQTHGGVRGETVGTGVKP
jgi:chromosome segregation ATPase